MTISILSVFFVISTVVNPIMMLSIAATIIICAPFLLWAIEMNKAFKGLREREKSIKARRKALSEI